MIEAQNEKNKKADEQRKLEEANKEDTNEIIDDVVQTLEDTVETVEDVSKTITDVESGNVVGAVNDVVKVVEDVEKVVEDVEKVAKDVKNVITSSGVGDDNSVQENYNSETNPEVNEKVFDGEDPWLKSKNASASSESQINIESVEEVD